MRLVILFILSFLVQEVFCQENIVYEVHFKGIQRLKKSFLQKTILTQKNNNLDSVSLEKDIFFLKRMPAVSHAYYQVFKSHKNYYNVCINIDENFTINPTINFWTTTNKRFAYKLGVYDFNFFGRNIAFGGFYQNNGFDTYAINFKAPNLFSRKWGLAINHQNWKSEEPLYFNNLTANYLYNNISFEVLGLYQPSLLHQIHFGINIFSEKYQYLSGATSPEIPTFLNIDKNLLKLVYVYNKLDYFYQYVSGFKNELYIQYVNTSNNFKNNFFIFWNDYFYFKRVGVRGNWANRLRFGLSSNENSPFAPFALDNNLNLRGIGILVDRGTGSVVLNSEYRYALTDKKNYSLQSNVFLDAGSWRNPGGELNDFLKNENLRFFAGFGLRFISKKIYNATFRIDYGFSLKDKTNGIVFGIGQYFN